MRRVQQITSSHCGPAACVMLLSYLGVDVSQESIVEAAGVGKKIQDYGMLVTEMAVAIKRLTPQFQFWHKDNATAYDLAQITKIHMYPIGVEWQGVFYDDSDEDDGHYSVVTHVDTENDIVLISDPYRRFAGHDRYFHLSEFLDRWWEENEVRDSTTGETKTIYDHHLMFVITDKSATFPAELGMI